MDLSSLHITAPSGEPLTSIALSTKYTSLGQCAPAIAGLGWVQSTDYDTQDCTKPAPPPAPAQGGPPGKGGKGHRGGAGGDASNRIAVQFDICCERKSPWSSFFMRDPQPDVSRAADSALAACCADMDPDFQNLVDDPATPFDETSIGDYLPVRRQSPLPSTRC